MDLYSIEAYYKKLQTLANSREARKYKKMESDQQHGQVAGGGGRQICSC